MTLPTFYKGAHGGRLTYCGSCCSPILVELSALFRESYCSERGSLGASPVPEGTDHTLHGWRQTNFTSEQWGSNAVAVPTRCRCQARKRLRALSMTVLHGGGGGDAAVTRHVHLVGPMGLTED